MTSVACRLLPDTVHHPFYLPEVVTVDQRIVILRPPHVLATAKHFLAGGGTNQGRDQGDARISEAALRDIHGAGYPPAIEAPEMGRRPLSGDSGAALFLNREN